MCRCSTVYDTEPRAEPRPRMYATPNIRLGARVGVANRRASKLVIPSFVGSDLSGASPTIHNKRDKMLQSPGEERITCGLLCVVGCSFVDQPYYLL